MTGHQLSKFSRWLTAAVGQLSFVPIVIPAALASSLVWVLADSRVRHIWAGIEPLEHHVWAIACVGAVAFVPAALAALLLELLHIGSPNLSRSPRRDSARSRHWVKLVRACALAAIVVWLVAPTASWAFSGARVSEQEIAKWGPSALMGASASATIIAYFVVQLAARRQRTRRWWPARLTALALALAGIIGVYADLHFYVSLYTKLHTALEASSFALVTAAFALLLRELSLRSAVARLTLGVIASAGLLTAAGVLLSESPVERFEAKLSHVFREPVYVGRQLQRLVDTRAFIKAPSEWHGDAKHAMAEFEERYGLVAPDEDPRWSQATFRKAPTHTCDTCNLLVFYVDTLRHDTTLDPNLMPNAVRFREQSLSFDRTYSTGSDTLAAVPGLTGGQYGLDEFSERPAEDLLYVARDLGMRRILTIPQSANEFLTKLYPSFTFDEVIEVRDYGAIKEDVWGYGADLPSAEALVDVTLQRLAQSPSERTFTWMFNFEVHSWHELDDDYLADAAARAGISTAGDKSWRYDVSAFQVDQQFGRLLEGLERLGLHESTIVLFVSDHGESLGQRDFWRHGTVLWESVIRVPLMLRVPGLQPLRSEIPVSLADVTPTLVSLLEPRDEGPHPRLYHGVDLLRHVRGDMPRDYPIVFVGRRRESLVRIALLEHTTGEKLVLPLETGRPELYDTQSATPDELDLAPSNQLRVTQLLDGLVRSPVYPRHTLERSGSPEGTASR